MLISLLMAMTIAVSAQATKGQRKVSKVTAEAACKGKTDGAECSVVTTLGETLKGQCRASRSSFACRPPNWDPKEGGMH